MKDYTNITELLLCMFMCIYVRPLYGICYLRIIIYVYSVCVCVCVFVFVCVCVCVCVCGGVFVCMCSMYIIVALFSP